VLRRVRSALRFTFREAAFTVPMVLLNVLFAGTSHVIENMPYPLNKEYDIMIWRARLFFGLTTTEFYESVTFVLLFAFVVLAYLSFRKEGTMLAVLDVIRWGSFGLIPLGVEIFLFDRGEFYVPVSDFQYRYNLLVWFTNEDLLFLLLGVFLTVTLIRYRLKSGPLVRHTA
jgi:hypothetical protein